MAGYFINIPTNKGTFRLRTIELLDMDFIEIKNSGSGISVTFTDDMHTLDAMKTYGGDLFTFSTSNGYLEVYAMSNDVMKYRYTIDGVTKEGQFSSNGLATTFNQCFVDKNGVYLLPYLFRIMDSYAGSIDRESSEDKVGLFLNDKNLTRRLSVSNSNIQSAINTANYLLDGAIPKGTDPYEQGGETDTGGGGGNFSNQSDNIGFSGVPDYDITTSGFVTAFVPTSAQLKSLANYMWHTLDLENWRKIFADPMDVVTSLMMLPVTPNKGSAAEVTVGNISTGISMTTLAGQIVQIDCGTLEVKEYWGSYLDYDPYTKIQIFLPYIGFRPISTDEIMGKTIHVKYNVDCLSGNCVAQILCGEDLLYSFAGSMGYQVPFSATDWSNFVSSTLTLAGSAITTVATGGASAPMTVPAIASSAVNMFKQNVDHSGTLAGNSGYLSDNYVYLTITRPRQALPKDQNKYSGYPSLVTAKLSDITGYTVVKEVHLENISCTGAELNEMENLLKQGVIL